MIFLIVLIYFFLFFLKIIVFWSRLPSKLIELSFLACHHILILFSQMVVNPFPNIDVWSRVDCINILHVCWEVHSHYFESMNLQLNCDIILNSKKIIHIYYVVLTCTQQKSAVWRESYRTNITRMPVFVFFYKNKWLKTSVNVWRLIYYKSVLLGNGK